MSIRTSWEAASPAARWSLVLGLAAIAALTVVLARWALAKDYQVLFTGLADADAAAMVAELDRMKLPYQLDGDRILVPEPVVHKTRLQLAAKNLPAHGGVGFEIFSNTDFGMTEFAQKVNYQRALQGELTRTILSLDEVQSARVHLALPDGGLFKRAENRAKASVTLALKPGRHLDRGQVAGIQKLVAASVPDIEPSGVTVLDSTGLALDGGPASRGEDAGAGDWKLQAKREVEDYLAKKLRSLLDGALGAGRGAVTVDVQLSLDNVKVTAEEVLPARGPDHQELGSGVMVRERQTTRAAAALATAAAASAAAADGRDAGVTSTDTEYQVGRRVEQIVSTPGSVKRISVGVVLPPDLDAAQAAKLRELIEAAAGLDRTRGDSLALHSLGAGPLPAAPRPAEDPAAGRMDTQLPAMSAPTRPVQRPSWLRSWGVAALAGVAALVFAAGWWASRSAAARLPRDGRAAPLSDEQRQRLLAELEGWLGEPAASAR